MLFLVGIGVCRVRESVVGEREEEEEEGIY